MARNSNSNRTRSRNNNPEGRNQYNSGWMSTARERPFTAAATAAAAVGAGVFLWSKRNQISDQLTNLSDQITDWAENMRSSDQQDAFDADMSEAGSMPSSSHKSGASRSGRNKTQQEISEEALTLKETGTV